MAGHRRSVRRTGRASDGGRIATGLILLDIGLPSLNGIEAARQMRSLVPESIIIFLTQQSSANAVQEALSLGGALRYVSKNMVLVDLGAQLLLSAESPALTLPTLRRQVA